MIKIAGSSWVFFDKDDVIALAKHFKLNAHDIECQEHIALQNDADAIDELHFDECQDLRTKIALLNQKLLMKKVN